MKPPSESFQSAVRCGWTLAKELGSSSITSAHILAGILRENSPTADVIRAHANDAAALEQSLLEAASAAGKSGVNFGVPAGSLPLSAEAENIVKAAMKAGSAGGAAPEARHIVAITLQSVAAAAYPALAAYTDAQRLRGAL